MTNRKRKSIYKRFFKGESVYDLHLEFNVWQEEIENILREGWREKWDSGLRRD